MKYKSAFFTPHPAPRTLDTFTSYQKPESPFVRTVFVLMFMLLTALGSTSMIKAQTFDCPCTGEDDFNIDAGTGTNVTATDLWSSVVDHLVGNTCIAIKGRLIINAELSIDDSNIFMQPGAEIVVLTNVTFRLGNVSISGCEQMWRSITLNSGGRLIMEECTVEDAQWAVRTGSMASGSLVLTDNEFDKNHIGVLIPAPIAIPFNTFQNIINRNHFTSTAELLPNFDSPLANYDQETAFAAFDISRVSQFAINSDGTPGNGMDGLRVGVISRGQHGPGTGFGLLVNNVFMTSFAAGTADPTIDLAVPSGIGVLGLQTDRLTVQNCTLDKLNRGIYTTRSSVNGLNNDFVENYTCVQFDNGNSRTFSLRGNEFTQYEFLGVHIRNSRTAMTVDVVDNDFTHAHAFNSIPISAPKTWGVYINGLAGNTGTGTKRIRENYFDIGSKDGAVQILFDGRYQLTGNDIDYGAGDAGTLGQIGAIHLSQSTFNFLYDNIFLTGTSVRGSSCISLIGAPNNVLCCNTTRNTAWGVRYTLMNPDTRLLHTTFGAHDVASLTSSSVMGQQVHAGNTWLSGSKAEHTGSSSEITGSRFFVEPPQQLPLWPVTIISPNNFNWFQPDNGSAEEACLDNIGCVIPMLTDEEEEIRPHDMNAALGAYDDSDYGVMLNWEAARLLYDKLERNVHLLGDSVVIDSFKTAADLNEMAEFYAIDAGIATLDEPTPAQADSINNYLALIEGLTEQLYTLDSLYAAATTEAAWDDITEDKEKILEDIAEPFESLYERYDSIEARSFSIAETLWDDNEAITPSNLPAENLQVFNRIFLSTVAVGKMTLSNTEFEDISDVAWQCPLEGGHAVLGARALYQLREFASFNDSLICDALLLRRPNLPVQAESATVHSIFPNPATGELTLLLNPEMVGTDLLIRITNLAGQEMLQIREQEANPTIRLNAASLNEGMYLLSVYQENSRLSSHKIAIIK